MKIILIAVLTAALALCQIKPKIDNSLDQAGATAASIAAANNTWTGANDFSGASSMRIKVGTAAPTGTDCDASGEQGRIYLQTDNPATSYSWLHTCTQTGAASWAWASMAVGFGPYTIKAGAPGSTTQSTSANNAMVSFTIPGGTLAVGDCIRCTALFRTNATDAMRSTLTFGGTTTTSYSHAATDNGTQMEWDIYVTGASAQEINQRAHRWANAGWFFGSTSLVTPAAAISGNISVSINAWLNAFTTDTITLKWYSCQVIRTR